MNITKGFGHEGSDKFERLAIFFKAHFYAEWLENQSDIKQAIDDYLRSAKSDPGGQLLLTQTTALLDMNLDEERLREIIEGEWDAQADSKDLGYKYGDVLRELRHELLNRLRS